MISHQKPVGNTASFSVLPFQDTSEVNTSVVVQNEVPRTLAASYSLALSAKIWICGGL
jgi:hypothetical protein